MPASVVGDDHGGGSNLRAQLDVFTGHDSFGGDGKICLRFDPLQILPSGRRVCSTWGRSLPWSWFCEVDAPGSLIVVPDVALPLGRPLGVQSNTDRLVPRCFRAPQPAFGHFSVVKGVQLEPEMARGGLGQFFKGDRK